MMTSQVEVLNRCVGCFVGLAVGDALGAPGEFQDYGTYPRITGYRDGGPFNLKAGQYTDDTSQALCLADAVLRDEGYCRLVFLDNMLGWYTHGLWSSTGECFDIGTGTAEALNNYRYQGFAAGSENSAGNGALMRLAPAAIAYRNNTVRHEVAVDSTLATHGHKDAFHTSIVLNWLLANLINRTIDKEAAFFETRISEELMYLCPGMDNKVRTALSVLLHSRVRRDEHYINETGYCLTSLVAAMHCFLSTDNFRDCVLKAVNLGGDTDSVGAIAGQLAGAQYGFSSIPSDWVTGLQDHEMMIKIAAKLYLKGI
jgi:ADP-ribosyl-[dinitrogen reductase] hydrolase